MGKIYSICVSPERGTLKKEVAECEVTMEGLAGDGHAGDWGRQITCLSYESLIDSNKKNDKDMGPGDMAENILIEGADLKSAAEGTKLALGSDVVIEVTQIGKPDHPSVVTRTFGVSLLPYEGLFCRVVKPGVIKKGDEVTLL